MIDVQFKIAQKRVAIHADPDVASGMARFVHELGINLVDRIANAILDHADAS